jgi:hypothetical protein
MTGIQVASKDSKRSSQNGNLRLFWAKAFCWELEKNYEDY